jgi:hypothetical protein
VYLVYGVCMCVVYVCLCVVSVYVCDMCGLHYEWVVCLCGVCSVCGVCGVCCVCHAHLCLWVMCVWCV